MTAFSFGRGIACGLVLLACAGPAWGNIGDSLQDLRGRYGSAQDMGGQMLFEVRLKDGQIGPARGAADVQNHFTVTVYFDNGHSAMEIFTRNSTDPAHADMSQDDIKTILALTGDGQQWIPAHLASGKPTWVRADKKLIAKFSPSDNDSPDAGSVLVIMLNEK